MQGKQLLGETSQREMDGRVAASPAGLLVGAGRMHVNCSPFTSASGTHKVGLACTQREGQRGVSPERKPRLV